LLYIGFIVDGVVKGQHIGNQINAAFIFARTDFVSMHGHG